MTTAIILYLFWILLCSCVTFAFYGWDKRQAANSGQRIPEKTLHGLAVAGGWPGAFLGQKFFRHKTQKTSFQIVFWLCVVAHCLASLSISYLILG